MILLDTHVLIWLDQAHPALGVQARAMADDALAEGTLAACGISFWETAMLVQRGRIEMTLSLSRWRGDLREAGLVELAVSGEVGIEAAELVDFHRDPADRMIVATARLEGAVLLTADERILGWRGKLARRDARL